MTTVAKKETGTVARRVMAPAPHLLNPAELPPELDGKFYLRQWAESLLTNKAYVEPDPEYMAMRMLMLTASATTLDELFADNKLDGLQDLIPNEPWATTGPIMVTDLYVAKSDQEDGAKTYMLLTYFGEVSGAEVTTSTGAKQLQMQICSMLAMGIWPIRCEIKRTERKDRGGRHMFKMFPVE
jgi:hypothetical protein